MKIDSLRTLDILASDIFRNGN